MVAIDLPGHGQSDWYRGTLYGHLNYAETVVRLLDSLAWRAPSPSTSDHARHTAYAHISEPINPLAGGRLHLLTHSMGASVGILAAGLLRHEVDTLICIDGFFMYESPVAQVPDMIADALASEREYRAKAPKVFRSVDEAARVRMRAVEANDGDQYISLAGARQCVIRNLRRVDTPSLSPSVDAKSASASASAPASAAASALESSDGGWTWCFDPATRTGGRVQSPELIHELYARAAASTRRIAFVFATNTYSFLALGGGLRQMELLRDHASVCVGDKRSTILGF